MSYTHAAERIPDTLSELIRQLTASGHTPLVSAWAAPTLTNSWVNYGGIWGDAAYAIDTLGFVHLRGLIMSGSVGNAAFTLPDGYRPTQHHLFAVLSNNAIGRVEVRTTGEVIIATPSNNSWVSLDNIRFHTG